jgi:hypothetical protein
MSIGVECIRSHVTLDGLMHLNPEIATRRMIRSLRETRRLDAARRSSVAKRHPGDVKGDREMVELFAIAGALSKEMGIELEIPAEWR